jgi:hypothetical protein
MAEQNRFNEFFGDRAAIDGDQRLGAARLEPLIARAIISLPTPDSPSIRIGICDLAARSASCTTRAIAGERVMMSVTVKRPSVERLIWLTVSSSALIFSALVKADAQSLRRNGLHNKVAGAVLHGRDDGVDGALRGLHDDRDSVAVGLQRGKNSHAVKFGHNEVEQERAHTCRQG